MRTNILMMVAAGLFGLVAKEAWADQDVERPGLAIIDTIRTTGSGENRPWGLFAGKPWQARVYFEELELGLNKPTMLLGVRFDNCRPPDDEVEVVVKVRTVEDEWLTLEDDEPDDHRIGEHRLEKPLAAWGVRLQVEEPGDCLAGLHLLGPDGEPLKLHPVEPVPATIQAPQTHGSAYAPHRMFDGDFATAWSTLGDGTGAELVFELAEPRWLTDVYIWPGYHRSEELWKQNAAPSRMTVTVDGGPPQSFDLPAEQSPDSEPRLHLAERVQARKITLRIDAVRKGTRYADTLITELRFADGDAPFIPDPTPAYRSDAQALRQALAPAGLEELVDGQFVTEDLVWQLGFFSEGRLFLRRYTNGGGDYYSGRLSFEVESVSKKGAKLHVYGAVTRVPTGDGGGDWSAAETRTINGQMTVRATEAGAHLALAGKKARFLPFPAGEYALTVPMPSETKQALRKAGFGALYGYHFRPEANRALDLHFVHKKTLRIEGPADDGKTHLFGYLDLTLEEEQQGRLVFAVSGKAERTPLEDGKPARAKQKKTTTSGKLVLEPSGEDLVVTPSGPWTEVLPLPAGRYALDW